MKKKTLLRAAALAGAMLVPLALSPGEAAAGDVSDCATVAACNERGAAAYKAKNWDEAIGHFENQIGFAELAEDPKQELVALNNLVMGHLKKGEPLYARAWLALARKIDPADKATVFNGGEVDKAMAALPARPAIGGFYQCYVGAGHWQSIDLRKKGKDVYEMTVIALRMGNAWREWGPAGIGELEESLTVSGNKAKFKEKFPFAEEACEMDLVFAGDDMDAEQISSDVDCGFGNGVAVTGHYYRVNVDYP